MPRVLAFGLVAAMLALVASCHPQQQEPPLPPLIMTVDAGYEPGALECPGGDTCSAACCNQRAHSCSLGFPTAAGNSCELICSQHDALGGQLVWPKACLAKATSCEQCQ